MTTTRNREVRNSPSSHVVDDQHDDQAVQDRRRPRAAHKDDDVVIDEGHQPDVEQDPPGDLYAEKLKHVV
jgi:hypothetical protein